MNVKVIQLDGSKYPYKSKKKRIYNKWVKKHTLQSVIYNNVVPTGIGMHQNKDGAMIVDVNCKSMK